MSDGTCETKILAMLKSPEGQQQAFAELMRLYSEPLYWHIRRLVVSHEDAEDVLQESFLKAYRYIDRFEGRSSLKTWLYRVATNEAIRHLRSKQSAKENTLSYDDGGRLLEVFEAEQGVDFNSMEAKLQRAILALPERQRMVFNLRYFDEMSYKQIAEVLESSEATLKTNYHYATEKIKAYMLSQIEG